jgi:small subunit ribosomal protein S1
VVLGIDTERERISLGIKQLDNDPYMAWTAINDKGAMVTGIVKTVDAKGAEIEVAPDVLGYLRASEISKDRVEDARNLLKEGDSVSCVVLNVDRKARSIQLSVKAKDAVDAAEGMSRLREETGTAGTTSLGALLRAKLDNKDGQ